MRHDRIGFKLPQGCAIQDRTGKNNKLGIAGKVDPQKLSKSEKALYIAITDKSATGTLNIVSKEASFDFEKYDSSGQNSLDRADLNQLSSAGRSLSGEVIAHAAMEAFDSAATGADYEYAHAFANRFFGRVTILGPVPIDSSRGGVAGLAYSYGFGRNKANVLVVREFDTPIPLQSLPRGAPAPGHVTKVERDKKK